MSIIDSTAHAICGTPNPRNALPGVVLVYTALLCSRTWGTR